jgi:hypothetical protein
LKFNYLMLSKLFRSWHKTKCHICPSRCSFYGTADFGKAWRQKTYCFLSVTSAGRSSGWWSWPSLAHSRSGSWSNVQLNQRWGVCCDFYSCFGWKLSIHISDFD